MLKQLKYRLSLLGKVMICLFKGHERMVILYHPVTGKSCSGIMCNRCKTIIWQ